jgi:hypothetical protein
MTDLSPAQKAVAAFSERHELCGPFDEDWVEQFLAAWSLRQKILAIAAELRGTNTTETP